MAAPMKEDYSVKLSLEKHDGPPKKKRRSPSGWAEFWCEAGLDQDELEKTLISRYIGFGVVATRKFQKGEFLLEYVGERINGNEAKIREQKDMTETWDDDPFDVEKDKQNKTDEEAGEGFWPSGGESAAETTDEAMEADALVKDLKTKHRRKQKEDDFAQEMKTIKKKSREKVEEAERQEEEDVAEDGTVPTIPDVVYEAPVVEAVVPYGEEPSEDEAKPEEEEETVKKVEEEVEPFKAEEVSDTARTEAPSEPKSQPTTPNEKTKTPRGRSLRDKMKSKLIKAKEEAATELQERERTERRLKREQKTSTRFEITKLTEKLNLGAKRRKQQC